MQGPPSMWQAARPLLETWVIRCLFFCHIVIAVVVVVSICFAFYLGPFSIARYRYFPLLWILACVITLFASLACFHAIMLCVFSVPLLASSDLLFAPSTRPSSSPVQLYPLSI